VFGFGVGENDATRQSACADLVGTIAKKLGSGNDFCKAMVN